ncbi:MAG: sigma-70 family RNA polymerase sigma factor [Deltaproteobacteria bacterium]
MGDSADRDLQLVRRALAGDEPASEAVNDALRAAAEQAVRAVGARSAVIRKNEQDLLQNFLVHTLDRERRTLASYAGRAPFASWVRVIASRFFVRQAGRERSHVDLALVPEAADDAPSPEAAVETRSLLERLAPAVGALPPNDRLLLSLLFEQELNASQAAKILGVGATGVRMRKKRLLERLADAIDDRKEPSP